MTPLYLIIIAFMATFILTPVLIKKFKEHGITGRDIHKVGQPSIPEMGGIAVVIGFILAVIISISLYDPNIEVLLAALATILIVAVIGMVDDIISIKQSTKTILPLFAAIPLMAVSVNSGIMLPIIGYVELGIIYPLLLIPLAVTVVSNLTNMLAGFNGLEAGLGIIACSTLGMLALSHNSIEAAILLYSMGGALLAFLWFNIYPAQIFIGDVGTLTIGACIASAVVLGQLEAAGVIVVIPYIIDFFIKVKNRFPREIDFTHLEDGRITATKAVGLPSLIVRQHKLTEGMLVLSLICLEVVCSAITLVLFL